MMTEALRKKILKDRLKTSYTGFELKDPNWEQRLSYDIWSKKDGTMIITMKESEAWRKGRGWRKKLPKSKRDKYTFIKSVKIIDPEASGGYYWKSDRNNLFPYTSREEAIKKALKYIKTH